MSVIWGIPYLFIKIALEDVSAPFLVFARTATASAVLLPIAWYRGQIPRALRSWRPLLAFAVMEVGGPWFLLNDAESHIGSSTAGLLIAAVPLISTVATWGLGDRSAIAPRRMLGLLVGMSGVAAVLGLDIASVSGVRMGEVLVVAVGYAVAPILADRRLAHLPALSVIALALTAIALAYLPAAVFSHPNAMPRGTVISAILVLGLVCTASAFLLYFALMAEVGAVRSTVITFINPVVAVLLGIVVLSERFTTGIAVGFPLVLVGSWLSTRRPTAAVRELITEVGGEIVRSG
jgi:drug/metabolite transporter (DMT)-like permease